MRTIQYFEMLMMELKTRGVLDTRLRGYDDGGWLIGRHEPLKQKRRPELGGVWIRSAEVVEGELTPE
jgi:hypothetical protein